MNANTRRIIFAATIAAVSATTGMVTAAKANAHPEPYVPVCSDTLVLALDGTKGPTTPTSIDPRSPLNGITAPYRDQPGTVVEHIAYPGGMLANQYGWTHSYDDSIAIGKSELRKRIATQERLCGPTTQYVLFGYSQGARVVGDVVSEMDSDRVSDDGSDLQDRVRVELYSDPRQPGTGIEVVLAGEPLLEGVTLSGERQPFVNIPVTWHCIPGDGVCDAHDPVSIDTLVGYILNHTAY